MNYDKVEELMERIQQEQEFYYTIRAMKEGLSVVYNLFRLMCIKGNLADEELNKLSVEDVDNLLALLPMNITDRIAIKNYFMYNQWMEDGKIGEWNPDEVKKQNNSNVVEGAK